MVGVTFIATNYAPGNDLNKHFMRETIETGGLPGYAFFPHVGKITLNGPFDAKGATDTPHAGEAVCVSSGQRVAGNRLRQADRQHTGAQGLRRPVTAQDTEDLLSFYQKGRNAGTFDTGIEMALRRVLADPDFVFRKEPEPSSLKAGQRYRISDVELASRLVVLPVVQHSGR